jgi:glucose-6-phosphate isomerase
MEFSYTNAGVSADEINKTAEGLLPYLSELKTFAQDALYAHPESFLHLVHDEKYINEITALANQKGGAELKHIFLVGIGGSNLGTRAVYEAYFGNEDLSARVPRIHFLDTIDTPHLEELAPFIESNIQNPNECIILYISKSGTTTESALNFEYLTNAFSKKFSPEEVNARTIVTTNEDSDLWKGSKEKNITTLRIPQTVGGRFSVFFGSRAFTSCSCRHSNYRCINRST